MPTDQEFKGWIAHNLETALGGMKWESFTPKNFKDDDIDVKITHCGETFI